jgi:hypothetical protein
LAQNLAKRYYEDKLFLKNIRMELKDITPIGVFPSAPLYPKKSRWKRFAGVFVLAGVVVVLLFYSFPFILGAVFFRDEVLLDNRSLLLQKVNVSDRDNGYADVAKFSKDTVLLPGDNLSFDTEYTNFAHPSAWNQQLVDQVLGMNAQGLDALSKAARKDFFQYPGYVDPSAVNVDAPTYSVVVVSRLSRLQAVRALSVARQGKGSDALAEAVKLHKLGHTMLVGHNGLVGHLSGLAMQRLASETMMQILAISTPGKGALLNTLRALDASGDNIEGYRDAFRFEYTQAVQSMDAHVNNKIREKLEGMVATGAVSPWLAKRVQHGYYYKPNQTKNLYTKLYEKELAAVGKTCSLGKVPELAPTRAVNWKVLFTKNAIGRLLFSATGISLGGVIEKQCENELTLQVTRAELGLLLYKIDHGALPQSLDTLVPAYMTVLPQDPYDLQPLRYSLKGKFLYSVGLGKQDRGGSVGVYWAQMENPTFQVTF